MRMWMVDPKLLCRKHLLGEHVELHMLVGNLRKGTSVVGFMLKGLVSPADITKRHGELVAEMLRRKYEHRSPIVLSSGMLPAVEIDVEANLVELRRRCEACRTLA